MTTPRWTFITNHGLVLSYIFHNPSHTAREIANHVGVTERTTHKIIMDLEKEGYITKTKVGRNNAYRIHPDVPIKTANASVGELLMMLSGKGRKRRVKTSTPENTG